MCSILSLIWGAANARRPSLWRRCYLATHLIPCSRAFCMPLTLKHTFFLSPHQSWHAHSSWHQRRTVASFSNSSAAGLPDDTIVALLAC